MHAAILASKLSRDNVVGICLEKQIRLTGIRSLSKQGKVEYYLVEFGRDQDVNKVCATRVLGGPALRIIKKSVRKCNLVKESTVDGDLPAHARLNAHGSIKHVPKDMTRINHAVNTAITQGSIRLVEQSLSVTEIYEVDFSKVSKKDEAWARDLISHHVMLALNDSKASDVSRICDGAFIESKIDIDPSFRADAGSEKQQQHKFDHDARSRASTPTQDAYKGQGLPWTPDAMHGVVKLRMTTFEFHEHSSAFMRIVAEAAQVRDRDVTVTSIDDGVAAPILADFVSFHKRNPCIIVSFFLPAKAARSPKLKDLSHLLSEEGLPVESSDWEPPSARRTTSHGAYSKAQIEEQRRVKEQIERKNQEVKKLTAQARKAAKKAAAQPRTDETADMGDARMWLIRVDTFSKAAAGGRPSAGSGGRGGKGQQQAGARAARSGAGNDGNIYEALDDEAPSREAAMAYNTLRNRIKALHTNMKEAASLREKRDRGQALNKQQVAKAARLEEMQDEYERLVEERRSRRS